MSGTKNPTSNDGSSKYILPPCPSGEGLFPAGTLPPLPNIVGIFTSMQTPDVPGMLNSQPTNAADAPPVPAIKRGWLRHPLTALAKLFSWQPGHRFNRRRLRSSELPIGNVVAGAAIVTMFNLAALWLLYALSMVMNHAHDVTNLIIAGFSVGATAMSLYAVRLRWRHRRNNELVDPRLGRSVDNLTLPVIYLTAAGMLTFIITGWIGFINWQIYTNHPEVFNIMY